MSSPTLGTLTLTQLSETGVDYPQRAQVVPILGDDPSTGLNAVIQSSARTMRQFQITWIADDLDDTDTARGYAESLEEVTYVDHYANSRGVVVIAFSSQGLAVNRWTCSATLVETTEPT